MRDDFQKFGVTVFVGSALQRNYKPSLERCRVSVADGGRSFGSHQCRGKVFETIDGFGFCSLHARKVHDHRRQLGLEGDPDGAVVIWVVSLRFDVPKIVSFKAIKRGKSYHALDGMLSELSYQDKFDEGSNNVLHDELSAVSRLLYLLGEHRNDAQKTLRTIDKAIAKYNKRAEKLMDRS